MANFYISPAGSDQNSGTSESTAWKSLDTSSRLKPGDVLTAMPGTISGTFNAPSGTAAAQIHFRAKDPGTAIVDGSVRIDTQAWISVAKGWQTGMPRLVFNVFQRSFETDGKLANFNNRDFNQYDSNPQLDLHGTPAEFKWANGALRLNAIPKTPMAEPLFAAITEVAINGNGKSHWVIEGIVTRGHKHAVATNGGTGIHLIDCRFTFCGSTGVWLVGLADAEMVNCAVQGAGSWGGHYEDCVHTERVGNLRLEGLDLSYGGHSGLIMLSGVPGKINLKGCYLHAMGGSLLTLKRSVDNLLVEDCWFAEAAKSTAVDAHKVPHAGIQLSGKGHVFRNAVFRDNGKDVLASSDGNADSNPVCQDILFDHCSFSGSEAGAVEGQEYAPAGRVERMTWRDCIIKGDVALFYAGQGDHGSNRLVHCQVVGSTNRGVVLQDCSSGPLPNTGSTLTQPPTSGSPPPVDPPPTPTKPVLARLTPAAGPPGTRVTAEGAGFGVQAPVIVSVTVKPETPEGKRRMAGIGNDTSVAFMVPMDAVTGDVQVRRGTELSNPLSFTVTGGAANKPPVANAGGPYQGVVGQPVQFDGSGSSDPDGKIARWDWGFGDGSADGGPYHFPVTHRYATPGTYTVTLTVTDNQGATAQATTTATITAAPPPAGDLKVWLSAEQSLNGAVFRGTAEANAPLPAGSTITVTARTPDGRSGTATEPIAGEVPPPPPGELPAEIVEVIRRHNELRAQQGLLPLQARAVEEGEIGEAWSSLTAPDTLATDATAGPLTEHAALTKAARGFAEEMLRTGAFSHTGEGGSTPFTRMAAAGYQGRSMGENIAKGFSTPQAVMLAWMNSPGHAANILQPAFKDIGVWFVKQSGIWVADFGG